MSYQKIGTVNVIEDTNTNDSTYVNTGYVMHGPATQQNSTINPNIAVGGVYSKGNISRSLVNMSNIGTYMGNFTLENISNPEIAYNYLTSLIPGTFPRISGPWSSTQEYYNLQEIQDYVNTNTNRYFCKILGLGLGEIGFYQVSEVSKNGVSMNASNFFVQTEQGFVQQPASLIQINWSSVAEGYIYPYTTTGEKYYMTGFDWYSQYNLESINGTNAFPFFGWAGSRLGSIKPQTFQSQQNSLYNYPSEFLQLAKQYQSIGTVYAGQGVQLNSFIQKKTATDQRTYQTKLDNNVQSLRATSILPYQQGRGIYEFYSNEITYNELNGVIDNSEPQTIVGAEGVQPGRNSAFMGFALTDYFSDNINLNNMEASSTTNDNTRYTVPLFKQTKTAHNAPLCYTSSDSNNTYNPLPWNPLLSYTGTSTSSSSNKRSDSTPILTSGITTAVISGAYPLYRGCWNSNANLNIASPLLSSYGLDQYYFTEEYWDPSFVDPATPEVINKPPVPPNPPYRIKGGRIILFEGQRVKAGSYVYTSMNMCGNVNMSQFYGPAAKDIVLNEGERDQLLGDVYSKYQSNQGGLIVMVSIDGQDPPMPPSCCQPIGVILEEIVGFGNPETDSSGFPLYAAQSDVSTSLQLVYDNSTVNQLQSRNILIEFFPMYPNFYVSGVNPTLQNFLLFSIPLPFTVSGNPLVNSSGTTPGLGAFVVNPLMLPFKSNYIISTSPAGYLPGFFNGQISPYSFFDFKSKQFLNDWPGPQSPSLKL